VPWRDSFSVKRERDQEEERSQEGRKREREMILDEVAREDLLKKVTCKLRTKHKRQ
jgi:hypothetical protein